MCGHHIYKTHWTPEINEELSCAVEENSFDRHAVAVHKTRLWYNSLLHTHVHVLVTCIHVHELQTANRLDWPAQGGGHNSEQGITARQYCTCIHSYYLAPHKCTNMRHARTHARMHERTHTHTYTRTLYRDFGTNGLYLLIRSVNATRI